MTDDDFQPPDAAALGLAVVPFHAGEALRLHVELGRRLEAVCDNPGPDTYADTVKALLQIANECVNAAEALERHMGGAQTFDWSWPFPVTVRTAVTVDPTRTYSTHEEAGLGHAV